LKTHLLLLAKKKKKKKKKKNLMMNEDTYKKSYGGEYKRSKPHKLINNYEES
jgi:hypothetical protein